MTEDSVSIRPTRWGKFAAKVLATAPQLDHMEIALGDADRVISFYNKVGEALLSDHYVSETLGRLADAKGLSAEYRDTARCYQGYIDKVDV